MTNKAKDNRNVHQRLAAAMQVVTYVRKERKQGMQYTIVSHDVVTAKVRPALLSEGIVYYPVRCEHTHNGNRAECSMTLRFVNIDSPEDFFDVQTFGYGVDGQDKGPGKAMSYAVKYGLLKAMGLETGDDADHDSVDHSDKDPHIATVSPDQFVKLRDKVEEAGADVPKFLAAFKAQSIEQFPAGSFQAAMDALEKKIAQNKPPQPNADLGGDELPEFEYDKGVAS